MTTPESNRTTPLDERETVAAPRRETPGNEQQTIDLRDTKPLEATGPIDLRDTALVPTQGGPSATARRRPAAGGDPAIRPWRPRSHRRNIGAGRRNPAPPKRLRRRRAVDLALTLALAAIVVWLLWPAGSLRVRSVSVMATPSVVACEKTADVVATVHTNGNAGQLTYRWTRNDGIGSGTLVQSLARGQHSVNLHLTWAFHGPGSYDARATVQLLSPSASSASVNFRYVC